MRYRDDRGRFEAPLQLEEMAGIAGKIAALDGSVRFVRSGNSRHRDQRIAGSAIHEHVDLDLPEPGLLKVQPN